MAPKAKGERKPPVVVVELVAIADPAACHGTPARDPVIRLRLALKALLRAYGLRCVAVRDREAGPEPAKN